MAGPLIGMLGKAGGAMFGSQVGAALGGLAGEVLTASDIGLPARPGRQGRAGARTTSTAFAEGLDVTEDDVLLYLSLREAAHQRLFAHVPWLREHLISAVEDFGRGVTIDISGIEEAMGGIDPTNLEAIQEALEGGLFEPQQTARAEGRADPARDHARARRGLGRRGRRPGHRRADAGRRQDAGGRSAAAAPPAGRPRRPSPPSSASSCGRAGCATPPRCGARCAPARARRPATRVWAHPDLLPTAADLDDPLGFREDLPEVDRADRRGLRRRRSRELLDEGDGRRRDPGRRPEADETALTLHADAVDVLTRWQPARRARPGALRDAVRRAPRRHPDGLTRGCFPDHLTAGTLVLSRRPAAACCSTCTARRGAGSTSAATSSPATPPWPARRCARPPRSPGSPDLAVDAVPVHLDEHAVRSATRAAPCTTSTCGSSRRAGADAEHAVSEESLDVRWWPVDDAARPTSRTWSS